MASTNVSSQRALMRDSMKRLKKLRVACGRKDADDEEKRGTGDEFRDLATEIIENIRHVKEEIMERNEMSKKHNNDRDTIEKSHGINKELNDLEEEYKKLQVMMDASEKDLGKAMAKKKAEKIKKYEVLVQDRRTLLRNVQAAIEDCKTLNAQRIEPKAGLNQEQQMLTNKRAQLKDILMQGGSKTGVQTSKQNAKRMEDDVELQDVLKTIKDNEKKIDKGLDVLLDGVRRLKEHAVNIGRELDDQNLLIGDMNERMDNQAEQLKGLNNRLNKVIQDYKPQNTILTVCCCVLLIAMIGYLIYTLGGTKL